MTSNYTIVIPAKNEEDNLPSLLSDLNKTLPDCKIILVDDGSTDKTKAIALSHGCEVISHPYSLGNGAAIKTGARAAESDFIVFMDADGQHQPHDIKLLLKKIELGYDMVVGARTTESQANIVRGLGNRSYNYIASKVTGHEIKDLTSGFRVVKRGLFTKYLYLLPNGFSYPTTITMAFFRSGYSVAYEPIIAKKRIGKSHINLIRDGLRFFIIIIKIATLYSPLKVFTPVSVIAASLGIINYAYTYIAAERFTNMSALLLIVSIIIFMLGLLAEQITVLTYASSQRREND